MVLLPGNKGKCCFYNYFLKTKTISAWLYKILTYFIADILKGERKSCFWCHEIYLICMLWMTKPITKHYRRKKKPTQHHQAHLIILL